MSSEIPLKVMRKVATASIWICKYLELIACFIAWEKLEKVTM